MNANEIRALIESKGKGATFTDKVKNISERSGIGLRSLWRYVNEGLPTKRYTLVSKTLQNLK